MVTAVDRARRRRRKSPLRGSLSMRGSASADLVLIDAAGTGTLGSLIRLSDLQDGVDGCSTSWRLVGPVVRAWATTRHRYGQWATSAWTWRMFGTSWDPAAQLLRRVVRRRGRARPMPPASPIASVRGRRCGRPRRRPPTLRPAGARGRADLERSVRLACRRVRACAQAWPRAAGALARLACTVRRQPVVGVARGPTAAPRAA